MFALDISFLDPTILIFKDGKVVESMVGLKSESVLLGALERLG